MRQRLGAIERADIVESKKSAGEDIVALTILAIDPPREIKQQLLKDALEKVAVWLLTGLWKAIHAPYRPRMHRRVYIGECELVSGQLTVSMHVPLAQK